MDDNKKEAPQLGLMFITPHLAQLNMFIKFIVSEQTNSNAL